MSLFSRPLSAVKIWLTISVSLTLFMSTLYGSFLSQGGFTLLECLSFPLFGLLSFWVSLGFSSAVLGLFPDRKTDTAKRYLQQEAVSQNQLVVRKTAVLVPVYNEDPCAVLARVKSMMDSLKAAGNHKQFDFFLLSDTTDPEVWLSEERLWYELIRRYQLTSNVFYRRRPKNAHRKSGNLADFCERWGAHYQFMIVLDADSLMAGQTMIEMVLRMEKDPKLGILQVPPRPIHRTSLFARLQQFSAWCYGPLCNQGFSRWAGSNGNYWGHNAIIRTQAFLHHCQLPILPGEKPLGGEILSHDFVEAAMMLRAGYHVELANDLEGSFEECPPTLADYAIRDQRWSQGNLQHFQLLISEGFSPFSRAHFAMGIMSYLCSPIWLLFLGLTYLNTALVAEQQTPTLLPVALFGLTMALLLLPKFFALTRFVQASHKQATRPSAFRLLGSVFLEIGSSILLAPIMAYYHSKFVLTTLNGQSVKWNCQQRSEQQLTFNEALEQHWDVLLFYSVVAVLVALFTPKLLFWTIPLLAGPLLIVPFAMLLSSQRFGLGLKTHQILAIPEELKLSPLTRIYQQTFTDLIQIDHQATDHFESLLKDPKFLSLHKHILKDNRASTSAPTPQLEKTLQLVTAKQYEQISPEERRSILTDLNALQKLQEVVFEAN